MSCIHYKFKSCIDYKTLSFDGLHISVRDLKKEIFEKEKIDQNSIDLQLSNGQTKRLYTEETELIPRNSSVDVAKIPALTAKRLPKIQNRDTEGVVTKATKVTPYNRGSNLMSGDAMKPDMSEEDRMKHVMEVSTNAYDTSRYVHRNALMTGVPPPTYVCNKCNKSGHWFKNCPLMSVRRTTGIPREELMQTTADDPQAMLTASGQYVVPIMHKTARMIGKKERPPFVGEEDEQPQPLAEPMKVPVPRELTCSICSDLLREAVLIPCCGRSFCDECIRNKLIGVSESDDKRCPCCGETGVSPDNLVPNSNVRQAVNNFRNEVGYSHLRGQQQQRPAFSGLKISLTGGQSQASVTLPSVLQQTLSKFLPSSYPTTAVPASIVPASSASDAHTQNQAIATSQQDASLDRVPSMPVIAQPPASSQSQTMSHSTSFPSLQAAAAMDQSHKGPPPGVHAVRPSVPTSTSETNSPSSHGAPLQPPGVSTPIAPMPASMSVPPPTGRMPAIATVAPMVQASAANMPNAPPPPVPPMMPQSRFLPPISFIPPPQGMYRPPLSMTAQPPPPGLFDPSVMRPPMMGPPGDRRSFGDTMVMAWDEFLARKDRKRTSKRRSESPSSGSSYTASRSRSRSRTPTRSPHSRGRKHRRRSYSRSPSPRRSRRDRRRTRSPRTPSPGWVEGGNIFRPSRGHRNTSSRARNDDWFFYAGATRHPPEFLGGNSRGNRSQPYSTGHSNRGPHPHSYSQQPPHSHQHQQPEPLSVFSQGDEGDYRHQRHSQHSSGESSRYHSRQYDNYGDREPDWQAEDAAFEHQSRHSHSERERDEAYSEKRSHAMVNESPDLKEKTETNVDGVEKKKKKKKLKSVSDDKPPKTKEGAEGAPKKKSTKTVAGKKRKASLDSAPDAPANADEKMSPTKENAPVFDVKHLQPVSPEKISPTKKEEVSPPKEAIVEKPKVTSPKKSTSGTEKDRSKEKAKSRPKSKEGPAQSLADKDPIATESEKKAKKQESDKIFPDMDDKPIETISFEEKKVSTSKKSHSREHGKESAKLSVPGPEDRSHERKIDKDRPQISSSRSKEKKDRYREEEPPAKRYRDYAEPISQPQFAPVVRSVFDMRVEPVRDFDFQDPEPHKERTHRSKSPSRSHKRSHSSSRSAKRSSENPDAKDDKPLTEDKKAKPKKEKEPKKKEEEGKAKIVPEESEKIVQEDKKRKEDAKIFPDEKKEKIRDSKSDERNGQKSSDRRRHSSSSKKSDKDSSKSKSVPKSRKDSPSETTKGEVLEVAKPSKPAAVSQAPIPEAITTKTKSPEGEDTKPRKFIDSFKPETGVVEITSAPVDFTSPQDFIKSKESGGVKKEEETSTESHKSKKEKKKKKKKSKDKSKDESEKKSKDSQEGGETEPKKHKKKRKKSKDEEEEPAEASVSKLPAVKVPASPVNLLRPAAAPKSSPPKGLRMEVKTPKVFHSRWEMSSDEEEEGGPSNRSARPQEPKTSTSDERRRLSPSIIARAEYALSGKTRLPPAARLGAKKKSAVVVTAGRSDRRVSLEGEEDVTRRVFSTSTDNPGSLSITVSDHRHSSEDDLHEFFGKREKINLKPVKLRKSWQKN